MRAVNLVVRGLPIGMAISLASGLLLGQCVPAPQTGSPLPGIVGSVAASVPWDPDGPGPAPLQIAMVGNLSLAGAVVVTNALAFDPATGSFTALGSQMPTGATCLATAANGANGGLFAGTSPGAVLAWNGSDWSTIGAAVNGAVRSLAVRSNGTLVAGGAFAALGGAGAALAQWNGVQWASLGAVTRVGAAPFVDAVLELAGGDLCVAGGFDAIAGVPMSGLARWNGVAWSSLGTFVGGTPTMLADDGTNGLVASGTFTSVNGIATVFAARWNGQTWSDFSTGLPTWPSFLVSRQGTLLAGLGATLGLWNGAMWTPLPAPNATNPATAVRLVGGDLLALGTPVAGLVLSGERWNAGAWQAIGPGTNGAVAALAPLPDGSFAVGGFFSQLGAIASSGIAKGDAAGFVDLANGQTNTATRLVAIANGDLAALTMQGDVRRWDGAAWSSLGGQSWPAGYGIASLAAIGGNGLLVGKNDLPLSPGAELWTWDGATWSTESVPGAAPGVSRYLIALARLPNGDRVLAGNTVLPPATHVATFDGTTLTPLPGGPNLPVLAVLVRPNGELVVGGNFTTPFPGIARWDGAAWQPLGGGIQGQVLAIAELPNGDLLVGGSFAAAGGQPIANLARWNGTTWTAFAPGPSARVRALAVGADGTVAVGGDFLTAGAAISSRIVFYPPACPAIAAVAGTGCSGPAGPMTLAATSLPWLGSTMHAPVSGGASPALVVGVRGLSPLALPLATVLPGAGAGCQLLVSPDLLDAYVTTGASLDLGFAIPAAAALIGQSLRQQAVGLQFAGSGALSGAFSSNALQLTIGSL